MNTPAANEGAGSPTLRRRSRACWVSAGLFLLSGLCLFSGRLFHLPRQLNGTELALAWAAAAAGVASAGLAVVGLAPEGRRRRVFLVSSVASVISTSALVLLSCTALSNPDNWAGIAVLVVGIFGAPGVGLGIVATGMIADNPPLELAIGLPINFFIAYGLILGLLKLTEFMGRGKNKAHVP